MKPRKPIRGKSRLPKSQQQINRKRRIRHTYSYNRNDVPRYLRKFLDPDYDPDSDILPHTPVPKL